MRASSSSCTSRRAFSTARTHGSTASRSLVQPNAVTRNTTELMKLRMAEHPAYFALDRWSRIRAHPSAQVSSEVMKGPVLAGLALAIVSACGTGDDVAVGSRANCAQGGVL